MIDIAIQNDIAKKQQLLSEILEVFAACSYPASTMWPYYLSCANVNLSLDNRKDAKEYQDKAEKLFLSCRDQHCPDWEKVKKLKSLINS